MPRVFFIWCHLGSSSSGLWNRGASLCPTGVGLRGAEMEPPPAQPQPSLPHQGTLPAPNHHPKNPAALALQTLQRTGDVTSLPQQLPGVFPEFPFQAARSPQLCCPPGQGSPQALQGCSVPSVSRIPSQEPSLAPRSASPCRNAKKMPRKEAAAAPRGSRRDTALEILNRAVTLQLQIAFLQETNPSEEIGRS